MGTRDRDIDESGDDGGEWSRNTKMLLIIVLVEVINTFSKIVDVNRRGGGVRRSGYFEL